MKLFNSSRKESPTQSETQSLLFEIEQTKGALALAEMNFEQVIDPTLIDCYIYELKAAQLRYQFLLRRAKQYGI